MEWQRHGKAAPGECAVASAPGGSRPAALARLEPQRTSACLHAARATPTHRDQPVATAAASPPTADVILSRAQRAHSRLSWAQRLARNARPATAGPVTIKLFGIPERFAASLGLATA